MHIINTVNYEDIKQHIVSQGMYVENLDSDLNVGTKVGNRNYSFVNKDGDISLLVDKVIYHPKSVIDDFGLQHLPAEARSTLRVLYAVYHEEFLKTNGEHILLPKTPEVNEVNPFLMKSKFDGSDLQIFTSRKGSAAYGYFHNEGQSPIVPTYSETGVLVNFELNNSKPLLSEHYSILSEQKTLMNFNTRTEHEAFTKTVSALIGMVLSVNKENVLKQK